MCCTDTLIFSIHIYWNILEKQYNFSLRVFISLEIATSSEHVCVLSFLQPIRSCLSYNAISVDPISGPGEVQAGYAKVRVHFVYLSTTPSLYSIHIHTICTTTTMLHYHSKTTGSDRENNFYPTSVRVRFNYYLIKCNINSNTQLYNIVFIDYIVKLYHIGRS